MTKPLNPTILKAYQIEFETSAITVENLIRKYKIDPTKLGDTTHWEKRSNDIIVIPPEPEADTDIIVPEDYDMITEIFEVKKLALENVRIYFGPDGEADMASTKEIKDMVGILKDLESGELAKKGQGDTGTTINVAIQNIVERFKDDC